MKQVLILALIALGLTSCEARFAKGDYVYASMSNGPFSGRSPIFGRVRVVNWYESLVFIENCDGELMVTDTGATFKALQGETCK